MSTFGQLRAVTRSDSTKSNKSYSVHPHDSDDSDFDDYYSARTNRKSGRGREVELSVEDVWLVGS